MTFLRTSCIALAVVLAAAANVRALGTEEFGNDPVSPQNYEAWPGLADVINDKSRIYYSWINGHEEHFFAGKMDQLNAALKKFAAVQMPDHVVLLRPGPGVGHSFNREKEFDFNWHLELYGGISAHLVGRDKGNLVWPEHPRFTIQISGDIDLAKLVVPEGVKLVSVSDLSAQARQGLESKDQTIRGWSAGVIAQLDPYDPQNLATLEKLLDDEIDWVRLNAANVIGKYGRDAKSSLPKLKECLNRGDESLRKAAQQAIDEIEGAPDRSEAKREHAAASEKIKAFVAEKQPKQEK